MKRKMDWLVFGAGAIGTYIGGSLALAGHRVVFIERPEIAQQVKRRGLRMNLDGLEYTPPNTVVCGSLEEAVSLGNYDVGLFALKSFDTQPALDAMTGFYQQLPPLLCLQNGVENEGILENALGREKVIAGTVTSAVGRRGPGDILLEKKRGLGVADGNPLSADLQTALDDAGLNAMLYPKAADMKWSKLLTNLLANASSAILNMTPTEIFSDREAYQIETGMIREALAVMAAQGYQVVDLPGTPVRLLAWGMGWLPRSISRPLVKQFAGKGRGEKMPSLHIDLHSGRGTSEVDYLNGAVVRSGKSTGIPTPVNRMLNGLLMRLTEGSDNPLAYDHQPEKLSALVEDSGGT